MYLDYACLRLCNVTLEVIQVEQLMGVVLGDVCKS